MDLRRLKYFCAVVEQGSLTKASKVLNMAQPPLSKRLQELEEELGVSLFVREGHRIEPSAAGYHLYQKAGDILRDVERAAKETVFIGKHETKTLRIGMSHLYQRFFGPLLMEIHNRIPDVEIQVLLGDSSHLEFMLSNGGIDLAFIQKPRQNVGYQCIDLPSIETVAVASKSIDMSEYGETIPFAALGKYPLVLLRRASGPGTDQVFIDHFRSCGCNPNVVMNISQPTVILDWMNSGLEGVALLPASEIDISALRNCSQLSVSNSPFVFTPSIVRMTTASYMPEIRALLEAPWPLMAAADLPAGSARAGVGATHGDARSTDDGMFEQA